MKNTFFPQALNEVMPGEEHNDASHPRAGDHDSDPQRTRLRSRLRLAGMEGARKWSAPSTAFFTG